MTYCSHVRVDYRKHAIRLRIQWRQDGSAPAIEEDVSGVWTEAQGAVTERFPARIYSQKQIFEIAEGAESLLRVIDESTQVNRSDWEEQWRTAEAAFLSLRAQALQLEVQLADQGRLRGHLADINKKLAVFESSNHRDVLRAYRQRQDQLRAVGEWERELQRIGEELRDEVVAAQVAVEVVAEPEIEREPRVQPPVVLREEPPLVVLVLLGLRPRSGRVSERPRRRVGCIERAIGVEFPHAYAVVVDAVVEVRVPVEGTELTTARARPPTHLFIHPAPSGG